MDKNPYVILGIAFGASRAEANAAFAKKAQALKREGGSLRKHAYLL
jgi:curved DNA-binding protein CbpA